MSLSALSSRLFPAMRSQAMGRRVAVPSLSMFARFYTSPTYLKYSKDHEWVRVEGDSAFIGITDHAQKQLGDIVFIEVPTKDKPVEKDETIGTVESVKAVSEIFSPLSGTVTDANAELNNEPESINAEPYESWFCKIKMSNTGELNELMDADEYDKFVEGDS
ncbi:MAG: glycine cleavage H-protein-domain-containing protein [Benniella sp.]|nr:MAG: glycine cleavage H-protein-domain-containing protein [Benniella sp.]